MEKTAKWSFYIFIPVTIFWMVDLFFVAQSTLAAAQSSSLSLADLLFFTFLYSWPPGMQLVFCLFMIRFFCSFIEGTNEFKANLHCDRLVSVYLQLVMADRSD